MPHSLLPQRIKPGDYCRAEWYEPEHRPV